MRLPQLTLVGAFLLALAAPMQTSAQSTTSVEPYALGTFDINGNETVGLVLRQQLVVELDAANRNLQMQPNYARMPMPADMLGLIGQYEYGLKYRLYDIVNHLVASGQLNAGQRPSFVHDVSEVRFLPPIRYPGKVLNAAGNFYSHTCEACTEAERAENLRTRQANRGTPYLFLKPAAGAVLAHNQPIVIPHGRTRTDWEVELATVIGRPAKDIAAKDAHAYVFGYTVSIDISDRGGRPGGGSDWLVGKGHDTFLPLGPWIVPKEFYGDPMDRLHQLLTINGVTIQNAKAGDMIHSVWELMEYASSIITLFPGDVLNSGTSSGTSSGAFFADTRSGYLQPGETVEASIEGIGVLRHPVVAGKEVAGRSGAQLPAVGTYQTGGGGGGGGN